MKKVFAITLFAVVLFVLSASAEVVKFPSVKITLDVEPGWTYADDGEGNADISGPDGSAFSIGRVDPEDLTLDVFARALVQVHNGADLKKDGKAYTYTYNGGKTSVIVSQDDTDSSDFVVIEITPNSQKSLEMMLKMLSSSKDI